MKDNAKDAPYQPVPCELHSQYELAIMHRTKLNLSWHDADEIVTMEGVLPVDIITKDKAEYLVATTRGQDDPISIRLDFIIAMHQQ